MKPVLFILPWHSNRKYPPYLICVLYCSYVRIGHVISSLPPSPRQWKLEQTEMLANKDAEEQANLEELKTQARNELAEWYSRHEEQLNQTKTLNR